MHKLNLMFRLQGMAILFSMIGTSHGKYEDSDITIPFFIRGPGIKENYELKLPVHSVDIVPTATWAMGLDANPWWRGRPVREAFKQGGVSKRSRRV